MSDRARDPGLVMEERLRRTRPVQVLISNALGLLERLALTFLWVNEPPFKLASFYLKKKRTIRHEIETHLVLGLYSIFIL